MNRRTFLSSTLAAAMLAVAQRLGFEGEKPKLPEKACDERFVDVRADCCSGSCESAYMMITATDNRGMQYIWNGPLVYDQPSGRWVVQAT